MDHAKTHRNVQPGEFGRPFPPHDINTRQILCALHGAELNMAKVVPWKHGILNNSSDDARDQISNQLRQWQHPLDTRRKDNNRVASDKWFTGEHFISFLKGNRGSPGGPIAIATLVMIIADDLQNRGVMHGDGELEEAVAPAPAPAGARGGSRAQAARGRGRGRGGRGRGSFTDRVAVRQTVTVQHPASATAVQAELERTPTRLEEEADPADLQIIHDMFGSRAQTLINILLAWDGFMKWYFPLKSSIPFLCAVPLREERALDNMQKAVDMFEIYERVCIRNSKSFMPHAAVFKMTRDILTIGDIWAADLSPLELQNAETKRVAESSGARNLEAQASQVQARTSLRAAVGPSPINHS